jgi:hypothetical protein
MNIPVPNPSADSEVAEFSQEKLYEVNISIM